MSFGSLMHGVDALPNMDPPTMRKITVLLMGLLAGMYCFTHLFVPLGLLPGVIGIIVPWLLIIACGVAPLPLFPMYREIVHETPQSWLIGIQTLRLVGYLCLPLLDLQLLPSNYAIPVGWGSTLTGLSAPLVAHAFATSARHARQLGVTWNVVCLLETAIHLVCDVMLLESFTARQVVEGYPTRYTYLILLPPPPLALTKADEAGCWL